MITLAEVLRRSTEYLAGRGSPTPRLDAELLLAHGLELSRTQVGEGMTGHPASQLMQLLE